MNAIDKFGRSPLSYAIAENNTYVASVLRSHGGKDIPGQVASASVSLAERAKDEADVKLALSNMRSRHNSIADDICMIKKEIADMGSQFKTADAKLKSTKSVKERDLTEAVVSLQGTLLSDARDRWNSCDTRIGKTREALSMLNNVSFIKTGKFKTEITSLSSMMTQQANVLKGLNNRMTELEKMKSSLSSRASAPLIDSALGSSSSGDIRENPIDTAEMVYVPAGEFQMGRNTSVPTNENPPHKVFVNGFWIYKYEVTVAQYKEFCKATHRKMPDAPVWGWIDDHPIVNVTWDEAYSYAHWAGGSLPTEAQWEKAARGDDERMVPWGSGWSASNTDPHYACGLSGTTAVGTHLAGASPYGCQDMLGNVWEWCFDTYDADYYKASPFRNPTGPSLGKAKTVRGGGWKYYNYMIGRTGEGINCCMREPRDISCRSSLVGFRVVF